MSLCLFTINPQILFFEQYKNNIHTEYIYSNISWSKKIIRRLFAKFIPTLLPIFFTSSFKKTGKKHDCIIIFDSPLTLQAANYIKKKYPNLRVIYWFWNHISTPKILQSLSSNIEKWSHDPVDCKKYGLKYNTQFYFPELNNKRESSINHDAFFIGHIKNREDTIEYCKALLAAHNLTYNFIVRNEVTKSTSYIPYLDTLNMVKSSRCIIDLLPDSQHGMSLRPLEALFFSKKLITNFKEISKCDFYHPNNIFILGQDDENRLTEFINSDLEVIDTSIIEKYTFNNWLKRFFA